MQVRNHVNVEKVGLLVDTVNLELLISHRHDRMFPCGNLYAVATSQQTPTDPMATQRGDASPLVLFFFLLGTVALATVTPFVESYTGPIVVCVDVDSTNQTTVPCQRPVGHVQRVQQTWWLPLSATVVNGFIVSYGPLLPYLLLAMQLYNGTVDSGHGAQWGIVVVTWVSMSLLRILVFVCVHPYNYYFSDHIFLLNCLLAQIQMSLAMTRRSQLKSACIEELLAALMVPIILFEAFFTSLLYHTLEASWLALIASSLLFQSVFLHWESRLESARSSPMAGTQQLIGPGSPDCHCPNGR